MATRLVEYEIATSDGTAIVAASTTFYYAATAITHGSTQDITGSLANTNALVGRSVTANIVDADNSLVELKVYLAGKDMFDRAISETLTFASGVGTSQQESLLAFRELTSVTYFVGSGAGGADTLAIGHGTKLGVPRAFTAITEMAKCRVDSTAYEDPSSGAGTFVAEPLGSGSGPTWTPLGGVVPNGSRRYYVQFMET